MSRHRIFHPVNLQYRHSLISPVLTYYYMEAPAHGRRFLSIAHFSVVNEANEPSSTATFTCSFCKQTRNSRVSLRYHAQQQHLIVHYWTCQKCNKTFALPSMWRAHILECDSTFGQLFLLNVSPVVIDAFADFYISRSPNNTQTLLYQPGLPDYRKNQTVIVNSSRNALQQWPRHIHKRRAVNIKPCYRFEKKSSKRVRQQEEESDDSDDEKPVKGFITFDDEYSEAAMDCQQDEEIAPTPSRPQTRSKLAVKPALNGIKERLKKRPRKMSSKTMQRC
ncbi:putative zinc finger protein [Orchesella cincta]|uniref:Putative zinc finger protein n=1 Tax=Orchesella cincta TaxID=48709 RepID=A0A1D2M2J4_ORCCI|nr:putative zinc finger protein [Orchesella cincta]